VEDVVRAYDLALNHTTPLKEPINFGTGTEVTITYLANKIIELCGKQGIIEPVYIEPRIGEVNRLIADASRAREDLGWYPEYDFNAGLKKFVEWYKNYGMDWRLKL